MHEYVSTLSFVCGSRRSTPDSEALALLSLHRYLKPNACRSILLYQSSCPLNSDNTTTERQTREPAERPGFNSRIMHKSPHPINGANVTQLCSTSCIHAQLYIQHNDLKHNDLRWSSILHNINAGIGINGLASEHPGSLGRTGLVMTWTASR
jgi:hypothetical protein